MSLLKQLTVQAAITRTSGLVLLAAVLPLACDRSTTSDVVAPHIIQDRATVGSIVTSNVATNTTLCISPAECHTRNSHSMIAQRVVDKRNSRLSASLSALLPSGPLFSRGTTQSLEGGSAPGSKGNDSGRLKNLRVTGLTLSGDQVRNGKTWHFELTHDKQFRSKYSAIRLSLEGKLVVSSNSTYEDIGGVAYKKTSDFSFYKNDRLAVRETKRFSPVSIEAGSAATATGISSDNLAISAVYAPDDFGEGGCPLEQPICDFFQNGDPTPVLNGVISALSWAATRLGNFFNALWAGSASTDAAMEAAQTTAAALEAVTTPSLVNIATAIGQAAEAEITKDVMEQIGVWVVEFLEEWLWAAIFGL